MDIAIRSEVGGADLEVSDEVFGVALKPGLIHQVVTAYMAGGRAGTKAQKGRSDVSGGGAKPWRQKGTGRARSGTSRGPIWRGGGVTFAARPRSYEQKVNRKMYRGALRSIVSELLRQERLVVVPELSVEAPKTKALVAKLRDLEVSDCLILIEAIDERLMRAARNLPGVDVVTVEQVDPVSLIAFEHLVATQPALKRLEERLA